MMIGRLFLALALGFGLSACATVDTATRNAPLESSAQLSQPGASAALPAVKVVSARASVPRSLKVSEANLYYPMGDIVWRGEPRGDRHAQVEAILGESLGLAAQAAEGALPVDVEVVVRRFHALTEKTRYTIGGVHSIRFDLILRDPATGKMIGAPREIRADLKGYGGQRAIDAETRGLTQKLRITRHLANVIASELARPGSAPQGVTDLVAGLETAQPI